MEVRQLGVHRHRQLAQLLASPASPVPSGQHHSGIKRLKRTISSANASLYKALARSTQTRAYYLCNVSPTNCTRPGESRLKYMSGYTYRSDLGQLAFKA
eukprot:scaffold210018_cov17-Prasinocladus_malaysianus.AAC.1